MTSPYCHYKPKDINPAITGSYRCTNAPATRQDRKAETFVLTYPVTKKENQKFHLKPLLYGDYCWYHELVVNPVEPGKESGNEKSWPIT